MVRICSLYFVGTDVILINILPATLMMISWQNSLARNPEGYSVEVVVVVYQCITIINVMASVEEFKLFYIARFTL